MTSYSRDFSSLSSSSLTSPGASYAMRRERSCSPSSRYGSCSSPTMGSSTRKNFSSSSFTGYSRISYPKVSVNKRLLTPLHLDIDPSFQEIRSKEKEEIKTLNNQFAVLIGKVQSLEQHNQVLLTRWNFLKEQDNSLSDLDIKLLYDQYMNRLRLDIRSIDTEKEQLDAELDEVLGAMDVYRNKYEEEIHKRTGMEFTFTTLKKNTWMLASAWGAGDMQVFANIQLFFNGNKNIEQLADEDLDNGFLHRTELEAKLSGLLAVAELMKNIYEQELAEVMSQVKDVSVVLGIDNNRYNPDPQKIVEDVRAQYEELAIRSWEELEALTRSKLNERELLSEKYGDHLLNDRRVIAELNIQIQKMRSCIVSLKSQCLRLEDNIKEAGVQGEAALNDAQAKLAKLEEALHNARQDLAHLVKEYQELMNIKLALDIEILTYRKLMEGEEISMESPSPAVISRIYSTPKLAFTDSAITTTSNVATSTKEHSTDKMSHSLESGFSNRQNDNGGFASDLSRSHTDQSGGSPDGNFTRSQSRESGFTSGASRRHTAGSTSSRSGHFADTEDNMETSISRSHEKGNRSHSNRSGDNLEGSLSRSVSGGTRDISEGSLSRSQSNKSSGLTDSVFNRTHSDASEAGQGDNYSRSQSQRSLGFSRTQSGQSDNAPEESFLKKHSSGSRSFSKDSRSSSQSSRGEGSFSGSPADPTRSQSDENKIQYGNEETVEPSLHRADSAEDGGVPVGGISRSYSGASSHMSHHNFSRSHTIGSDRSEESAEPNISIANSAEDGGVPVGSISRSYSGASSHMSHHNFSRSHTIDSDRSEECAEPNISIANSAEDGGVPVGSISRSYSGTSSHVSGRDLSRSQTVSSSRSEEYAEPNISITNSAEDGGVPVGSFSISHSEAGSHVSDNTLSESQAVSDHVSEGYVKAAISRFNSADKGRIQEGNIFRSSSTASRSSSQSGFPRSQRDQSGSFSDTVFSRTHSEHTQEGSLPKLSSGNRGDVTESPVSRSHSGSNRAIPRESGFRTPSIRSATLTDSVFVRTPSNEKEEVHGELCSRASGGSKVISESSFSRMHSDDSRGPLETSTPICLNPSNEDAVEPNLSRSQSGESGSFKAADFYRRPSEGSSVSEASFSRSCSSGNESFPEGLVSRNYSYKCAVALHPQVSKTESEAEDVSESNLSRSHSSESDRHSDLQRSHSAANEGALESGESEMLIERSTSRTHNDEPKTSSPVCMVYEVRRGHHASPTDEALYYAESISME